LERTGIPANTTRPRIYYIDTQVNHIKNNLAGFSAVFVHREYSTESHCQDWFSASVHHCVS
jgi:hypothetical protein